MYRNVICIYKYALSRAAHLQYPSHGNCWSVWHEKTRKNRYFSIMNRYTPCRIGSVLPRTTSWNKIKFSNRPSHQYSWDLININEWGDLTEPMKWSKTMLGGMFYATSLGAWTKIATSDVSRDVIICHDITYLRAFWSFAVIDFEKVT